MDIIKHIAQQRDGQWLLVLDNGYWFWTMVIGFGQWLLDMDNGVHWIWTIALGISVHGQLLGHLVYAQDILK